MLDYSIDLRKEIDLNGDYLNQVTVWLAPSGPTELAASHLLVSDDVLTMTLTGGQPRRDYMIRLTAMMTNNRIYSSQVRIGILPELSTDRAVEPASWGFGPPLVWTYAPSLDFTQPRNAVMRLWGWV